MDLLKTWNVGDPCFAKVKGYCPYPARIEEVQTKLKKVKFAVFFYGTNEEAVVGIENIWKVTEDNVDKFVNSKSMKKEKFKLGYEEMVRLHGLTSEDSAEVVQMGEIEGGRGMEEIRDLEGGSKEIEESRESEKAREMEGSSKLVVEEEEDEFEDGFDELFRNTVPLTQRNVEATKSKAIQADKELDDEENEDCANLEAAMAGNGDVESGSKDKGALIDNIFENMKNGKKTKKNMKKKGKEGTMCSAQGENGDVDDDSLDNRSKQLPSITGKAKKAKTKQPVRSKISKTLIQSEEDVNAAFEEKIEVKDDDSFHCRICQSFVTNVKLLAKSHAQSCGVKKNTSRITKRISCSECGKTFGSKADLIKHTKEEHTMSSYECTVCLKKFTYRVYYTRHMKIHDKSTAIVCPFCPKTFQFESYQKRHIKRCHSDRSPSFLPAKALVDDNERDIEGNEDEIVTINDSIEEYESGNIDINNDEDESVTANENKKDDKSVTIEVNSTETKRNESFYWKYEVELPNTERLRSSHYQSFYNTLGFVSQGDWDEWLLVSEALNLPYSLDGTDGGFEVAVVKQGDGAEKIVCVGSTIATVEKLVMGIILEIVDSAVALVEGEEVDKRPEEIKGVIEELLGMVQDGGEEMVEIFNIDTLATGDDEMLVAQAVEMDTEPTKKKPTSVTCHLCGLSGMRNAWFLKRHLELMHSASIKCNICEIDFVDKFQYLQHSKGCFFWCSKSGCSFHEKRKGRVESHERSHQRDS